MTHKEAAEHFKAIAEYCEITDCRDCIFFRNGKEQFMGYAEKDCVLNFVPAVYRDCAEDLQENVDRLEGEGEKTD